MQPQTVISPWDTWSLDFLIYSFLRIWKSDLCVHFKKPRWSFALLHSTCSGGLLFSVPKKNMQCALTEATWKELLVPRWSRSWHIQETKRARISISLKRKKKKKKLQFYVLIITLYSLRVKLLGLTRGSWTALGFCGAGSRSVTRRRHASSCDREGLCSLSLPSDKTW